MKYTFHIVTGAPGAGKSTTIDMFIGLKTNYLAFDIDWLASTASELAQKSIYFEPATWKPYAALWFDVLHSIYQNGKTPIFFTPNTPQDIENFGRPDWCQGIRWLLLDCEDNIRRTRLQKRQEWNETRVNEALADARELRQVVSQSIDTGQLSPNDVAYEILNWLNNQERT